MKRNLNIFLLAIFVAFASCSFTTKTFDNPDKDKLLMQLITYLLEQGHFQPKDFNDDFSKDVYSRFLKRVDPYKHYFYQSDLDSFKEFELELDDQIQNYDVQFFNIVYEQLMLRIEESNTTYKAILSSPFDYDIDETFQSDPDQLEFVSSKKQMRDRWRKQLKLSTLSNYHDLISEQDSKKEDSVTVMKSKSELEAESRAATLKSLEETAVYMKDLRRDDWLSMYINSIAESFDPHTFYFAPQDKERFELPCLENTKALEHVCKRKWMKLPLQNLFLVAPLGAKINYR